MAAGRHLVKLQQHRAVSLRQHGFLVEFHFSFIPAKVLPLSCHSFCIYLSTIRLFQIWRQITALTASKF